jgi:superfamily I DNA/RNA helicase
LIFFPPEPLDFRDLALEIDGFIWGYHVSREEYCDQMISRSGLRHKLDADARRRVWEIQRMLREELEGQRLFTRNLALMILLEEDASDETAGARSGQDFSRLYLDEVQDLPPVVLKYLARRCGRLIMAGDVDQSIYGLQSPFARAGIDIRGRSRILNQNFRNTIPILELAEAYRSASGLASDYPDEQRRRSPRAFREGPPVGLVRREKVEDLEDELIGRLRVFRDILGYAPENICVICPDNRQVDRLIRRLEAEGDLAGISIRDPRFDFGEPEFSALSEEGSLDADQEAHEPAAESSSAADRGARGLIRLSPLHSAKGLDFPVVLLYLPYLQGAAGLDRRLQDSQRRNLIYVGLTRAMDHLDLLLSDGASKNPVIRPLTECWETRNPR